MRTLARAMTIAALSVAIGGFAATGTASADSCTTTTGEPALDQWVDTSNVPALNTCFTSSPMMTDTAALLGQLMSIPDSFPTLSYSAP